jgi:hypothetical protein
MQFASGAVITPDATKKFVVPTVTVTVTSTSQKVFINSHASFGRTGSSAAAGLDLFLGYRLSAAADSTITLVGSGLIDQKISTGAATLPAGMTAVVTGLAPGTYVFGMCTRVDAGDAIGTWNANSNAYTTTILSN